MDIIITGREGYADAIAKHRKAGTSKTDGYQENDVLVPSSYLYVQETPKGALVYQTITNALVRLSRIELEKLHGKRTKGKRLEKTWEMQGLLVPAETDECACFLDWARAARKKSLPYLSLNITTTLACNARCAYCYEKGVRQKAFDHRMIAPLLAFLRERLPKDGKLMLNWFGGEPLLGPAVIDEVTAALTKENIDFSSYLITNGSKITKRLIDQKFQKWNVRDVQITLDGLAKTYESRKQYRDQRAGIFMRILKKIETVAKADINVHVRLNIDRENMDEMLELLSMLEERYGTLDHVTWYPAFLTGVACDLTPEEKTAFVRRMFAHMKNPGKMNAARRLFSAPRIMPCMRCDRQSYSIDVNGNIYRCEHDVGHPDHAMGQLSPFSLVERGRATLRLPKACKACVFLPKCMGGCAANKETNDELCMIERYMIQGYLAFMAEKEGAVFDEETRNPEPDPASGESSGEVVRNHRTAGTAHRNTRRRKPART